MTAKKKSPDFTEQLAKANLIIKVLTNQRNHWFEQASILGIELELLKAK